MPDIISLISLELYIQLALPVGYVSYLIARLGGSHRDNSIFVVYIALFFSLLSVLSYRFSYDCCHNMAAAVSVGIFLPMVMAGLWRRCFESWFFLLQQRLGISNRANGSDTWSMIINHPQTNYRGLIVYLKSGRAFGCENVWEYDKKGAPNSPVLWDGDGNLAFYADLYKPAQDSEWQLLDVKEKESFRMQYIHHSNIENVEWLLENRAERKTVDKVLAASECSRPSPTVDSGDISRRS